MQFVLLFSSSLAYALPCQAGLPPSNTPAPLFLTHTFPSQDLEWKSHAAGEK